MKAITTQIIAKTAAFQSTVLINAPIPAGDGHGA